MERARSVVTAERFAKGMTFEQYVQWTATPENLKREGTGGAVRKDWSNWLRRAYAVARLSEAQTAAVKWLVSQPGGPAKVLMIAEEWSSDCRRDLPMLARLAEAGGMELRIFARDGQRFSRSQSPSLAEAPDSNADIMAEFMNEKNGQRWQSIPVVVFYAAELEYLYHYVELPVIYDKDRIVGHLRAARQGETPEETRQRGERLFYEMLDSPFFEVWQCAAVDEMCSRLYERLVVGPIGTSP